MNFVICTLVIVAAIGCKVEGKRVELPRENTVLHEEENADESCGEDHPCRPHDECCGRVFGEPMCLKRPSRGEMCDPTADGECPGDANFCDCPCQDGYQCEEAKDGTSVAGRPVGYCKKGGIHATIRNHTEILDGLMGRASSEEDGEDEEDEQHMDNIRL